MNRLSTLMIIFVGPLAAGQFLLRLWHPSLLAQVIEHVGKSITH